jgi:hypothetical protein
LTQPTWNGFTDIMATSRCFVILRPPTSKSSGKGKSAGTHLESLSSPCTYRFLYHIGNYCTFMRMHLRKTAEYVHESTLFCVPYRLRCTLFNEFRACYGEFSGLIKEVGHMPISKPNSPNSLVWVNAFFTWMFEGSTSFAIQNNCVLCKLCIVALSLVHRHCHIIATSVPRQPCGMFQCRMEHPSAT